jgi:hypothetical protein
MKVLFIHFDCPAGGLGCQRLPAQTSRPWHRMCTHEIFGDNGALRAADTSS